ncbi:excisionase family DNA-binding protein [Microbacterium sp.]|uniref:excisionase family DNA-binding protein n=1 Tax=Microbacterium sp. TaxID=51671 RepID=UPI003C77F0B7
MRDTLTINPANLSDTDWSAIQSFLNDAREAGAVVELSQRTDAMSPAEFARRLSTSRATVLRRIADGTIKATKVGTHHRIPEAEFQRFSHQQMVRMAKAMAPEIEAELFGA